MNGFVFTTKRFELKFMRSTVVSLVTVLNLMALAPVSQALAAEKFADAGHGGHAPGRSMPSTGHGAADHEHGSIEVSANQPIPAVALVAHPDPRQGWNLEIQTTNFQFAPQHINQATTATNEGHAHLYIDGEKVTRLYGNWYYLSNLPPGQHQVTVSLNANGHEALMHNGQPIQATVVIDVPATAP